MMFDLNKFKLNLKFKSNGCRMLQIQDPLMTDNSIFSKMHLFKAAMLLYQSSLELKSFIK